MPDPAMPDPQHMLRQSISGIEKRSPELTWSQLSVQSLSECDTFLFSATGPDGKVVSGLLVRSIPRPDLLFAVTDLSPVTQEMARRITSRLPPPRQPAKAMGKAEPVIPRPQPVLPPTESQRSTPQELVDQGRMLAKDAEKRKAERLGRMKKAVSAPPGSIAVPVKPIYPPGVNIPGPADLEDDVPEG